ncbi:MAG: peptidoglycan DD-metalloendopeptidase family protein [Ferruginibacter sp.]
MRTELENVLLKNQQGFRTVVDFNPGTENLYHLNFTTSNKELAEIDLSDTEKFSRYVDKLLKKQAAKFGIGGYLEDRVLYKRSQLFNSINLNTPHNLNLSGASRSIHLGIDIWGPAGTEVFVPIGGMVHSFAFNDHFGDYGATIILQHQLDTIVFHTLYGHVSLADMAQLQKGKYISRGEIIAHFGKPTENGSWPPHLHFQVIGDMNLREGDYPGVCTLKEASQYAKNCPNPDLILNLMQFAPSTVLQNSL